jgi:flagellar biosynthesis/type III secretory pathway protein FliH
MMSEPFRFPTLEKTDQQQSLHQRLEQAEKFGWQKGFDEGVRQNTEEQKEKMAQEINERVEALIKEQLDEHKQALLSRFNVLFEQSEKNINLQSDDVIKELCVLITKVTKTVLDCELKMQPQRMIVLVQQAIELLAGRDKIKEVIFSSADKDWLDGVGLEVFTTQVTFDEQLPQGDVQLIADKQTHSLSFSQRLDALLSEATTALLSDE